MGRSVKNVPEPQMFAEPQILLSKNSWFIKHYPKNSNAMEKNVSFSLLLCRKLRKKHFALIWTKTAFQNIAFPTYHICNCNLRTCKHKIKLITDSTHTSTSLFWFVMFNIQCFVGVFVCLFVLIHSYDHKHTAKFVSLHQQTRWELHSFQMYRNKARERFQISIG